MLKLLNRIFAFNEREIKKAQKIVDRINDLEKSISKLSDEELKNSSEYFRRKLGIDLKKVQAEQDFSRFKKLDKKARKEELIAEREKLLEILPEVFARVREAAKRVANHRHFDVQLIGGILLAQNNVIEVFTGEGKTNIALLPAYLYALTGRGVHVHTVNDYLARRDAEWAGHIFKALGMSTAVITPEHSYIVVDDQEAIEKKGEEIKQALKQKDLKNMSTLRGTNLIEVTKKQAYQADIVYGQASEFGFDYLRDNMAKSLEERVQRSRYYAIVDEADSILIDEARTPLIISMPDQQSSEIYKKFAQIVDKLEKDKDYIVDEKDRAVVLTDDGVKRVEKMLNGQNIWQNNSYLRHLNNALKAKALFFRDKDYIVKDGQVLIVDEFTGRVQPGRRYSEGLHQAIEAKEGVEIKQESKTLATISYQNYFRLYDFLAGMTGTAMTEAEEFNKIYGLNVIRVPTYKPIIRKDYPDLIYKNQKAKFKAIVEEIKRVHKTGRPILVGTTSIEVSEYLSNLLKKEGIYHQVLNAKHHEKEAHIVAKAGQKGAVTIATNMAGRGTDIKINDEVKKLGGLYILGTERHEARRIDNQLRGRAGRLGDPGSSRFFVSLEDELMRRFGGQMVQNLMEHMNFPEDMPIESKLLSSTLEKAQKKVESMNFDIRKRLVEYDDVLNDQRDIVYDLRHLILILLEKEKDIKINLYPKLDWDYLDNNIWRLVEALQSYTLKDPFNYHLDEKDFVSPIFSPLRFWLLKQIIERVSNLFGKQSKGHVYTLTNSQFEILKEYIESLFPDDIWDILLTELDLDSKEAFWQKVVIEKNKDTNKIDPTLILKSIVFVYAKHFDVMDSIEKILNYEKYLILSTIDFLWMEHIDTMADLREGIGLVGYAQRDPLVEYKRRASQLFNQFFFNIKDTITKKAFRVGIVKKDILDKDRSVSSGLTAAHQAISSILQKRLVGSSAGASKDNQTSANTNVKLKEKPGRNDPCPCGSGKKYKKCCYPKYG